MLRTAILNCYGFEPFTAAWMEKKIYLNDRKEYILKVLIMK